VECSEVQSPLAACLPTPDIHNKQHRVTFKIKRTLKNIDEITTTVIKTKHKFSGKSGKTSSFRSFEQIVAG